MSNETDLDWLARVLHKWPDGDSANLLGRGLSFFDTGVSRAVHVYAVDGSDYATIKEVEWLARRAELQNKPSWGAVPSHANWLAQDAAGSWLWHSSEPECRNGVWIGSTTRGYAAKGCVIGDWRDTLEKRPEQDEFEPFVSIEDNQEQDMTNHQDMKQDNGWFERGELPPPGVVCEIFCDEEWEAVFVVGSRRNGDVVVELGDDSVVPCTNCRFRPIRTERDMAIDEMKQHLPYPGSWDTVGRVYASALYDAGYRKESK